MFFYRLSELFVDAKSTKSHHITSTLFDFKLELDNETNR